jgi:hypothetical protein
MRDHLLISLKRFQIRKHLSTRGKKRDGEKGKKSETSHMSLLQDISSWRNHRCQELTDCPQTFGNCSE